MEKVYIALYTCGSSTSRNIHFNVVPALSAGTFISSFERFICIRGIPRLVVKITKKRLVVSDSAKIFLKDCCKILVVHFWASGSAEFSSKPQVEVEIEIRTSPVVWFLWAHGSICWTLSEEDLKECQVDIWRALECRRRIWMCVEFQTPHIRVFRGWSGTSQPLSFVDGKPRKSQVMLKFSPGDSVMWRHCCPTLGVAGNESRW